MGALVAVLTLACAGLAGCSSADQTEPADPQASNPFSTLPGYAAPDSRTAQAAAQARADGQSERARVFSRLAGVAQGIWLTPEEYPPGEVGPYVASVVTAAQAGGKLPLFVVYGISDRDCSGGFSEGGLSPRRYPDWVREIAGGVSGASGASGESGHVTVVLEPDALAAALECSQIDERVRLMSSALDAFVAAGVTTYVDGGHSHWISPPALARLMRRVGVERARGFATNVANYQSDDDERDYAGKLSKLLGGAHFVIDSGRNGNGSTPDWCNPTGRAFGTPPGYVDDGTGLDAFVWVKPPGESDGECGGGPAAGEFWPGRTMAIAAASGW